MKWRFVLATLLVYLWAMTPHRVMAQPVQLFDCIQPLGDACLDVSVGDFYDPLCGHTYESFRGRVAWNPLRYVGPINLEVLAHTSPGTRFPIYFEVVALAGRDPSLGYCDGPGEILELVSGRPDCEWGIFGPIDLTFLGIQPGELYVVRAHFLGDIQGEFQSPFFACVRVAPAAPVDTPVALRSWGMVKKLYK
jgi:hypothetical protein